MSGKNSTLGGGGFHHVAVKVHDYEAAVKFYTAIGMTPSLEWGEGETRGVMLDAGDGNYVEVFAGGEPGPKPTWGEGAAVIHFCIRTDDVDAATKAAAAAGGTVTREPSDVTIGNAGGRQVKTRLSFVQAPGGEVVEFMSSPGL